MERRIAWITALTGAGAGFATWLISEPFAPTVIKSGTLTPYGSFSLGSFYGWFAHLMLGALIAGSLAYAISLTRTSVKTALIAGFQGALLGGALVCGADALADWVNIRSLPEKPSLFGPPTMALAPILWHVLASLALALAIAMATQPTAARYRRALAAAAMAAFVGYMLRQLLAPFEDMAVLTTIDFSDFDQKKLDAIVMEATIRGWQPWSLLRLAEWTSMGIIMGLALSLSDIFMRTATLRLESGRGAGNTYPLDNGQNRIGTAEGLEVRLPFQEGVLPVHAMVDARLGHWALVDMSGNGILLNGHPVREALFQEGEVATIGPCQLRMFLGKEGRSLTYEPSSVTFLDVPSPVVETVKDHRLIDPFGAILQLPQGSSILGRGDSAQIRLDYDARISPQHALLEIVPGAAYLQPLDPANPATLNGELITGNVQLEDGDRIKVGNTTLHYRS